MQISLNGEATEVANDINLASLISDLDIATKRFAVEVNEELIPRSEHPSYILKQGDNVEIVQAIGGG